MKVVCASIPGPGHAFPMIAVGQALALRGHEVVLATGKDHESDAARARLGFSELPHTEGSPRELLRPYQDAARGAEGFAPVLASIAPDVLVADLVTVGTALAAETLGIPHATLSIHPLHTPSRDLPPFGLGRPPLRGPLRAWDAWLRRNNRRNLVRARAELNAARARLGLPPTERLDGQLSPHLVLVATLPALEIPRGDWPEHAYVIGPCLWDGGGAPPDIPPGEGRVVLVAPTTAHDATAFARAATEAVRAAGGRAILPARHVSHDALLPSCHAVLCSGGHGIVARALTHGVPLVVVPGHGDQRENGYRVERAGAGLRVMRPDAEPIARALGRVLSEPAFRVAARKIQAEARALDGPARAAELIEALAWQFAGNGRGHTHTSD